MTRDDKTFGVLPCTTRYATRDEALDHAREEVRGAVRYAGYSNLTTAQAAGIHWAARRFRVLVVVASERATCHEFRERNTMSSSCTSVVFPTALIARAAGSLGSQS